MREKSPGPCAYETITAINPMGRFFFSKYKNSMASVFNPVKSKRFFSKLHELHRLAPAKGKVPGPGQYEGKLGISAKGTYALSNFSSSLAQTFGKGRRSGLVSRSRIRVPGPGAYRACSEFGNYEKLNGNGSTLKPSMKSRTTLPEKAEEVTQRSTIEMDKTKLKPAIK